MRYAGMQKQKGFTLFEILLGTIIFILALNFISFAVSRYIHTVNIQRAASDLSLIPKAVQKRNAHDGFLFSTWDENGGTAPEGLPITWEADEINDLLNNYLVGREHPSCGNAVDGWNPFNTAGGPDAGDVTSMETTALVGCNKLRNGVYPFNVSMSAVLTEDATGVVSVFALYLDMANADFTEGDTPENNILNFQKLKSSLESSLSNNINGQPRVQFVVRNDLDDLDDDVVLSSDECEEEMQLNQTCDIAIFTDYSGVAVGLRKRTDNLDFFLDDVTFGQSLAAGRQTCAFWQETAGVWDGQIVDCGIKAGAGDDDVQLVVDKSFTSDLFITNEADLTHTCNYYRAEGNNLAGQNSEETPAPDGITPCGITQEGNIVQLISDEAHVETIYGENIIAERLYASETVLYSDSVGDIVLRVFDATNTISTFSIDNLGNTFLAGELNVDGDARFESDAYIEGDLNVLNSAFFEMANGSNIIIGGPSSPGSLEISRTPSGAVNIDADASEFNIRSGNNEQGISLNDSSGDIDITLKANNGVILENGTTIHSAKSILRNENFNAAGGIDSESLKNLSELVTSDMAKYLDDTSSPIQIVGIEKIEGEFLQLTKPDCLHFMDDSNYSSPDANPYSHIDRSALGNGEAYARLTLIPKYFKTYNAAFGDNQFFSQHAAHSSSTTWDIFLYLSGEGAFGTGAREDGAGGSLALVLCDYSSIDFSRQTF